VLRVTGSSSNTSTTSSSPRTTAVPTRRALCRPLHASQFHPVPAHPILAMPHAAPYVDVQVVTLRLALCQLICLLRAALHNLGVPAKQVQ